MPWSETSPMDERARFVLGAFSDCFTMTELCERYGISRKTGYKWIERYRGGGDPACADASRAPRTHPNATPEDVVELIVQLRGKYPDAGPRTLVWHLEKLDPRRSWPSPSTIGEILKRRDLIKPRRRRRPRMTWSRARTLIDAPNQVWTADFKGQFRLRNGLLCYPLTILDGHTRFLLTCRALKTTATEPARRGFEAAFEEFGLPSVIRTDNGVPFAAPSSVLGLSGLSVWLLKLGIRLERSRPGKPQDNGAHERMHRTLKSGACRPPRGTFSAQQRALNESSPMMQGSKATEAYRNIAGVDRLGTPRRLNSFAICLSDKLLAEQCLRRRCVRWRRPCASMITQGQRTSAELYSNVAQPRSLSVQIDAQPLGIQNSSSALN